MKCEMHFGNVKQLPQEIGKKHKNNSNSKGQDLFPQRTDCLSFRLHCTIILASCKIVSQYLLKKDENPLNTIKTFYTVVVMEMCF